MQRKRGNIEDGGRTYYEENEIDPLRIIVENKDHFPKVGLEWDVLFIVHDFCVFLVSVSTSFSAAWDGQ